MYKKIHLLLLFCYALIIPAWIWGQTESASVASRTDGLTVYYYATLNEAFESAKAEAAASIENPVEITLLADIVLDEPLLVEDGAHIRLVAGDVDRIIKRGSGNIEYPVIWVEGENASLALGKPSMEYELIIDGGYLNDPPLKAHAPIAAVSGPDSKLILYDKVTLQNNYNNGDGPGTGYYQHGGGVFIRTAGDFADRQAEFIMKGGIIRGNVNDAQNPLAVGGGVLVTGFGIFTMEGGIIMDNTARFYGGGFAVGGRASFSKLGGIVYGKDAPVDFRNTVIEGNASVKIYGHSITVAISYAPLFYYRDDTVGENDTLSYTGNPTSTGVFGKGDKWENRDKVLKRRLFAGALAFAVIGIFAFFILRKRVLKKRLQTAVYETSTVSGNASKMIPVELNLTAREKEIGELLLTKLSMRQIAHTLQLSYSGVAFHSQNIYRKLGIQSRTELLARFGKK